MSTTHRKLDQILVCIVLLLLAVVSTPSLAADSELLEASPASALGSVYVSMGTAGLLSVVGELTVTSVEVGADAVSWVLEGVVDATGEVVRLTVSAAQGVSIGVGTVVEVVGVSAGWLLTTGGSAIAFVADAVGESIYHSSIHR